MNRFVALGLVVLLLLSWSSMAVGGERESQQDLVRGDADFLGSTAKTMAADSWEVGVFGSVRYGLSDRVELSSYPVWFLVVPNLRVKVGLDQRGPFRMSWTSGVSYPTPLLRVLSRPGAGGVHPAGRAVPHIISIANEWSGTYELSGHYLTGAAGVQIAPRFGESEMISIDVPVVYGRIAAFFTTATALSRLEGQGPLVGSLGYRAGAKLLFYPGAAGTYSLEHYGQLRWRSGGSWMAQAGYLISYGGYPFGRELRVLPLMDVAWRF